MKLFELFTNMSPNKVFLSIVLGALAGSSYSILIPIVLNGVGYESSQFTPVIAKMETLLGFEVANYKFALLFLLTCLVILFSRSCSQILLVQVAMDVTTKLRVKLYHRISKAPVAELDKMGYPKLVNSLTTDVNRIVTGAKSIPDILVSMATIIGLLSFLIYLNTNVFLFVIGAIILGGITYQIPMLLGNRYIERGRYHVDALQKSIQGLVYGAKELKLSRTKRNSYFKDILLANEYKVLDSDKRGNTIMTAAMNYGDLISFFVIGIVTFIFVNYHAISSEELIGVIMALLYLTTPVAIVLARMPQISVAKISLRKLNQLLDKLPEENAQEEIIPLSDWDTLTFSNVFYDYGNNENNSFKLGPINLEIKKNEITMIIGGNGSGKSTLCKLLALHYIPSEGEIHFGKTPANHESLNSCRQFISAIFTDYYLFDRLLGEISLQEEELVDEYLKELGLSKKVQIKDGHFSTLSLSDGQKKRLALLVSFLEEREMYIFDEWAADQDPLFKEVFYHKVLPNLKAKGKAVIVISHDDRYFDIADKLIVMEEGHVESVKDLSLHLGTVSLPTAEAVFS